MTGCEKLSLFNQSVVCKLLRTNILDVPDNFSRHLNPVYFENPLIILSALNLNKIAYELYKAVKVHLKLHRLNKEQIIRMLKMKNQFFGINASDNSLQYIAENSQGNPSRAARIWSMAKTITRAENKCKISIGLCKGKTNYDKKNSLKEKDLKRDAETRDKYN